MATTLLPGSVIGILGGGQLGRMLSQSAARLGFKCHIYCPSPDSPAFETSALHTKAAYDDWEALSQFAKSVSVVTYEFENVPGETADFLNKIVPVRPGPKALAVSQDRLTEKNFLKNIAGTDIAGFAQIDSEENLVAALNNFGGSGVLKTRRFGYDGKGQVMLHSADAAKDALDQIGRQPAIFEELVPFTKEISIIAARNPSGEIQCYDPAENRHLSHILNTSTVPASISSKTAERAKDIAENILHALDYIGVIGVELFVVNKNGIETLLVNEIAPRVHNSGHWTESACFISQFEQHIRAICGWSLGSPTRHSDVIMENLIGEDLDRWQEILKEKDVQLTLYGKAEARKGRKMGHVNKLSPLTSNH
ncbi:5-(carboxyamino)imidazole ribonucleotide synthase [Flexibacterium corallicola]|uniref:5-(carboxyamino)imidazole ribonucleotide synthase n=1 Tax=Flexibacterium corallicola TaxID=3037259 RepID=UPI00286EF114|nr:5-(carboxyamino)imidazole ribonucleotide synthase [Pseudovibrio sp. M1P-2-3]